MATDKAKKSSVYTRTGDKGETSLYSGKRVSKCDPRIEAIGTLDETNCHIGVVLSLFPNRSVIKEPLHDQLVIIQKTLFSIGAHLATPRNVVSPSDMKLVRTTFDPLHIPTLENWIDTLDSENSPLTNFILPGGSPIGAQLHLVRSVVRRLERSLVEINDGSFDPAVPQYVNRLSDYFFVAARWINKYQQGSEIIWKGV